MASLKDSLLDGMSGKLDKYIIYQVGNETFIRKRPKKVSNHKSEKHATGKTSGSANHV